jgi:hypothetical protein
MQKHRGLLRHRLWLRRTFIVQVNVEEREGSPFAAALHQGYGEEYVIAYLRTKMPAGSPMSIEAAHQIGVGTVLSDSEGHVLLNPGYNRSGRGRGDVRRDDDPVHDGSN